MTAITKMILFRSLGSSRRRIDRDRFFPRDEVFVENQSLNLHVVEKFHVL